MGIHELPPVTDQDGNELSEQEQDAALDETKVLPFEHTREDGKIVRYAMAVDPSRITAGHLLEYQRATAQLTADIEAKEADIEAIEAQNRKEAKVQTANRRDRRAKTKASENDEAGENKAGDFSLSADDLQIMVSFTELQMRLADAEAALLVNAIVDWNVRQSGAAVAPSVAFLRQRTGPGGAAHAALKEWFFPTSVASEAETGATETANTSN